MTADQDRRSFLKWAIHGMGALFGAILGIPAVAYLIDARNRPARQSGLRPVDGIRLGNLEIGDARQGTIRAIREDAWTLHPNDVIGRVWVVKYRNWQGKPTPADLGVFTTICPHLGCSINKDPRWGFTCPCHDARYKLDGAKVENPEYSNVAPRGMDALDFDIDKDNPDLLLVDFKNFYQGRHDKTPKA